MVLQTSSINAAATHQTAFNEAAEDVQKETEEQSAENEDFTPISNRFQMFEELNVQEESQGARSQGRSRGCTAENEEFNMQRSENAHTTLSDSTFNTEEEMTKMHEIDNILQQEGIQGIERASRILHSNKTKEMHQYQTQYVDFEDAAEGCKHKRNHSLDEQLSLSPEENPPSKSKKKTALKLQNKSSRRQTRSISSTSNLS